ncbi:hypothetical protein DICSQDRAFT_175666 [Dichomitus squalens LYAD-421 SS1]|uniref:Nucleoplasmin-like domain-containing protein n=1 Tax=Dichomitus squalens (strain LYAD-421) TaxID=732165 RepID=R7SHM7_DICSQ|nr:uncharacterized protein DICSQDRAFT_175666 [Dichomitus squalens LYAD-421 SS1]EJF55649.1 hypothetical protein DICSQDRAFT_175666 [Dichomitus squalens LYAD-421 SS1]
MTPPANDDAESWLAVKAAAAPSNTVTGLVEGKGEGDCYLIHSLRLNYLCNIDDPYGPRLISLCTSFHSSPSGLADATIRFPQPEGNLKYTTIILDPSRTGMMGLWVNGKRASMSRNSVMLSMRREADGADQDAPAAPTMKTPITTEVISAMPVSPMKPEAPSSPIKDHKWRKGSDRRTAVRCGKTACVVPIIDFQGAAEMERRRRQRLLARAHPPGVAPRMPMVAMDLNPEESSSSSEEEPEPEPAERRGDELADEEDEDIERDGDSSEFSEDEFDLEFVLSAISTSASLSSMMASPEPPSTSAHVLHLSPIQEGKECERLSVSSDTAANS